MPDGLAQMSEVIGAVRALPLHLFPGGAGEPVTPVVVQIRADRANFRYGNQERPGLASFAGDLRSGHQ